MIISELNKYSSVNLSQLESKHLMKRFDTKFVVNEDACVSLLKSAHLLYDILEIDGQNVFEYHTSYFDTDSFDMYHDHHNKRSLRFKVRERTYESGESYLEIKRKENSGKTIKNRIERNKYSKHLSTIEETFIEQACPYKPIYLSQKLSNSYKRITLVHKFKNEKITIDFNISFQADNSFVQPLKNSFVIEVKQEKKSINSPFIQILKKRNIREISFSKYCIGASLLYPKLKQNRFKKTINTISKTEHFLPKRENNDVFKLV